MRFEFSPQMIKALGDGAALRMGVNHDFYQHELTIADPARRALLQDLGL
jgi:hypothetical protein